MKKTWLIYVDIIKFNIFGYIKEQLQEKRKAEILWGIDEKYSQIVDKEQEVYFYLTNAKRRNETDHVDYHFLKRFAFKGIITEITEEKPKDGEFWRLEEDADKDLSFEKYARIKIVKDLTDKNIKSNAITWNMERDERRMFLLEDENIARLEDAFK